MSKEVITVVINETLTTNVSSLNGVATMFVLNGAWEGSIDWMAKEYFASRYPTDVHRINQWRMATREDIDNCRR
ncbi:hypothetical protein Erwinia_phage_Farigoule_00013 [Erwinia phage Farigoule]|nr:hypothetical protein Erwinia_phage_Farigoule_00013 [Erwinia phage Farigoule]